MKSLIAESVEKSFGNRHILRGCSLSAAAGERIGLVGANGSGKTTLVRILAGDDWADHGEVRRLGTMAWLAQDPVLPGRTVGESLREAVGWHATLLDAYTAALEAGDMDAAGTHQDRLDLVGWEIGHRIESIQDRLRTPSSDAPIANLSGGELRRVALARALLAEADVLLLDEPTNHLDAETVVWLEGFLAGYRGAVILVTHDRYLLEAVANRIVEIEGGECVAYDGSYADYLIARAERHARLQQLESRRLNMLAREAAWAARSPSARSTKQKARLKRLEVLQGQKHWTAPKEMSLNLSTGEKFGGTVVDVQNLSKGYDGRTLISGLSFSLAPGERIGIVGENGAGKSTLLRMLLGKEAPDGGEVLTASRVTVGVLDQARTGLKGDDSVFEAAGGGNDHVWINKVPIHVAGFLERFLFTREHLDQRVDALSGGERARLLLARLLLGGSSMLFLDEPTNDLDLLTLRVLEEALLDYDGAALVVTHDRAFLDRVCTSVLAFEGNGQITRYASRTQAEAAMAKRRAAEAKRAAAAKRVVEAAAPPVKAVRPEKRLSYQERKELETLPAEIESAEESQAALTAKLADPATYQGGVDISEITTQLSELESSLETLYARWEDLEARA